MSSGPRSASIPKCSRASSTLERSLLEFGYLQSYPASWTTTRRAYTGGFAADLMLKDLGLATDAAKQAKHVVMGAMAQQLYQL